jgi:vancomycin aglycone glucosyltransferase
VVVVRVLLSTIGSRGDAQPLVALASRLRDCGHEACLCVSPDFREWIEGLGFPFTPIGPQVQGRLGGPATQSAGPAPTPPGQRRELAEATVVRQFTTISEAARGCDAIVVAAGRPLVAARTAAEALGIRYVFAVFSPSHLPSPHHAPFAIPAEGEDQPPCAERNLELWDRQARQFNDRLRPALNLHRGAVGLAPIDDVRDHMFTSQPWLAADPVLGPWPGADGEVFQTGAWILPDYRQLGPELEAFLRAGDPPVYFGFGSMRMPPEVAEAIAAAARHAGRRAIISAGWAGLNLAGGEPACLVIGEVNQQALFPHVAAVVHHGGAGTTVAAALAGTPQVIVPQAYDQHYWARRICDLGLGAAHAPGTPTAGSLTAALRHALQPGVVARARSITHALRTDGAQAATASLTGDLAARTVPREVLA